MSVAPTIIELGPYRQGEVPEPWTYVFEDVDGNPINLGGYQGRLEYARWPFATTTERNMVVAGDQDLNRGKVSYVWVTADFANAGDFDAEAWVGDQTRKLASVYLRWHVQPAIHVPTGI